ncbi:MAG: SDR family oxidoreductase [Patescibacteria group bacterium]
MIKIKKNKNVLVTGASGMLGLEVVRYFLGEGLNVTGLFHSNPKLIDKSIKHISCDIGDTKSINSLAKKIPKLDLIVHCASMTGVDKCEKDKEGCFRANVIGTRNMVALAEKYKAKIIYISTGSVFSGEKGNYKEGDFLDPRNYYSFTKTLGEEAVLAYSKGIVVRATPIGIHASGRPQANFLEWMVDAIKSNKPLNFFTDVYINALSALTMAKFLFQLATKMDRGVIHLGSKDRLSKADIGLMVVEAFKEYSGEVKLVSIDSMSGNFAFRPKEMWLNVGYAKKLGLKMPNLKEEVKLIFKK